MTILAQYYSHDIHNPIGKDFPYYERTFIVQNCLVQIPEPIRRTKKETERKKKTKARIQEKAIGGSVRDLAWKTRNGAENFIVRWLGKKERMDEGMQRRRQAVFAKLTWEADRRMCLGVVRVVGVPRGCCTLPAEAEDRRRDQACHAQDQKHQPDHEPDRLHAQDRRCLRVCEKV